VANRFAALSVEEQGNKADDERTPRRNRKKATSNTPAKAPEALLNKIQGKAPAMAPTKLAAKTRPKSHKKRAQ